MFNSNEPLFEPYKSRAPIKATHTLEDIRFF